MRTPRLTASSSAQIVDSSVTKYGVVDVERLPRAGDDQQVEALQIVAAAGRRAAHDHRRAVVVGAGGVGRSSSA